MKRLIKSLLPLADIVLVPIIYPAALLLKAIRKAGVSRMRFCKGALMRVGVFPILNHYYEPLFDGQSLSRPLDQDRDLPGIDWNVIEQLNILESFDFNEELKDIPKSNIDDEATLSVILNVSTSSLSFTNALITLTSSLFLYFSSNRSVSSLIASIQITFLTPTAL